MKDCIYTVRACRWGDRETHSYIVGVYSKKHAALKSAAEEEEYRGGKYECEVIEMKMNTCIHESDYKVIKALPKINTLESRQQEAKQ